jgi:hypothetical protein
METQDNSPLRVLRPLIHEMLRLVAYFPAPGSHEPTNLRNAAPANTAPEPVHHRMSIERSIDEHMLAKVARLREMGFEDESKSRAALGQVGGNVNLAVEKMLSGVVDHSPTARGGDEPLRPAGGAGGGPAPRVGAGSGGIASIFNLSQRAASVVQPAAAGKPRSRPTAHTSKPASRLRSTASPGAGLAQALMNTLPLKRSQDNDVIPRLCETPAGSGCRGGTAADCTGGNPAEVCEISTPGSGDESGACSSLRRSGQQLGKFDGADFFHLGQGKCVGAGVQEGGSSKRQRSEKGAGSGGAAKSGKHLQGSSVQMLEDARGSCGNKGAVAAGAPLAERMRPCSWEGFIGQRSIRQAISGLCAAPANLPSLILWGPPGCGKTTLAKLVLALGGKRDGGAFRAVSMSAVRFANRAPYPPYTFPPNHPESGPRRRVWGGQNLGGSI